MEWRRSLELSKRLRTGMWLDSGRSVQGIEVETAGD
jgi:hypothetical protein